MLEDPLITWPGGFPYRVLAGIGITPRSTRAEVENAVFTLMTEDLLNPATQQALNQLRDLARRLLLDLLLYDIGEEDLDRLDEAVAAELANPGEPGEVTEALRTIPVDVLAGLADELADPRIEPPIGLAAFPTQSFLDSLIGFDR